MSKNCRECNLHFKNDNYVKSKFLNPFMRQTLIKNLQKNLHPTYQKRIKIMLLADIGKSQTEICKIVGCSRGMAHYWIGVVQKGMAYTWDLPIGRPKTISNEYIEHLKELASKSPREYGYAFSFWTAQWLSKHLAEEFDVQISGRHINRLLKQMGISIKEKESREQD